jgi:hypothetical protein
MLRDARPWLVAGAMVACLTAGCRSTSRSAADCGCQTASYAPHAVVSPALPATAAPPRAMPAPPAAAVPNQLPASAAATHTTLKPGALPAAPAAPVANGVVSEIEHGHAPDFGWIVGELIFDHARKTWRVRYGSIEDEDDRFGGSVTLDGGRQLLANCRPGQPVRVQGKLADPEAVVGSPRYLVADLKPLSE